jgi:hypothetical protein
LQKSRLMTKPLFGGKWLGFEGLCSPRFDNRVRETAPKARS